MALCRSLSLSCRRSNISFRLKLARVFRAKIQVQNGVQVNLIWLFLRVGTRGVYQEFKTHFTRESLSRDSHTKKRNTKKTIWKNTHTHTHTKKTKSDNDDDDDDNQPAHRSGPKRINRVNKNLFFGVYLYDSNDFFILIWLQCCKSRSTTKSNVFCSLSLRLWRIEITTFLDNGCVLLNATSTIFNLFVFSVDICTRRGANDTFRWSKTTTTPRSRRHRRGVGCIFVVDCCFSGDFFPS